MKKSYLLIFLLSFILKPAFSQVYEPGNMVVDAYYGWPNLFTAVVKSSYEANKQFIEEDIKIGSIGPLGGKFEYLISERIGIGLNVNYANTSVKAKIVRSELNSGTGTYEDVQYNYKASLPRLRIMPMINIHIGSSDKVDPYVAFGGGYSSFNIKETTNDPNYKNGSVNLKVTPVALRAEFGVRYFFTDHFGISGQFGLGGGPLLAAGLAAKF